MKKLTMMMVVVLLAGGCFAQKSNVNKAKSLSSSLENPDFAAARNAIAAALEDPSTKDLTNTWYVAGLVGYNEFQYYQVRRSLQQSASDLDLSKPTSESYNYWLKADELSQIPDAKGKVDNKTRKNIVSKMLEYYRAQTLIIYGYSLYENGDYKGAYTEFLKHLDMSKLPMMQDPKTQQQFVKDTTYCTYLLYAARFAYMAKMYPEAIATFERFNTPEIAAVASRSDIISANEFIYQSYIDQNDTVNAVASLQQSIQRFPEEAWFIQNLINLYINSKQSDVAIEYLTKAIEKEPQKGEYYMIRGNLLLNENKLDEALADLEKSISIDEKLVEGQAGIGRVYYNKAVMKGDEANRQSDQKAYEAAKKEEADLYFQSVPYFEKAHQLAPDDRNISLLLKGLYWRFRDKDGYLDKYNKLNEELNK